MGRRLRRSNNLLYRGWYGYSEKEKLPKYRTKEQLERSEEEWEKWLIKRLVARGWKFRQDLQSSTKRTSEKELEKNLLKNFKIFLKKNNLATSFDFDFDIRGELFKQLKSFKLRDLSKSITIQAGGEKER